MDTAEYLPMFLAEGREHFQELNLAVVRIEEQPDDTETIDAIPRRALDEGKAWSQVSRAKSESGIVRVRRRQLPPGTQSTPSPRGAGGRVS